MRFLADECCDFAVVRALRAAGHDVTAVAEVQQRSVDQDLVRIARIEGRVLLTEDKDFGWLVFAAHLESPGVILLRFPASARGSMPVSVLRFVDANPGILSGAFVVLEPGVARISRPAGKQGKLPEA